MRRNVMSQRSVQGPRVRRHGVMIVAALGVATFVSAAGLFAREGDGSGTSKASSHRVGLGIAAAAQVRNDSAAVVAVVERFHTAVVAGDSALVLSLLTPDAIVLESGGMETREEFRARHLPADIAFAQAVKSERGPVRVVVRGDAAWATSTSTAAGEYRGRQVNSSGAELMVLARTPEGWRIAAIHWSSRARRPAGG